MRLHLAENQRTFTPLPEIEAALEYWRFINEMPNSWAKFQAIQFKNRTVIRVKVGYTSYKGTKEERRETAFKTREFFMDDGEVSSRDIPHL